MSNPRYPVEFKIQAVNQVTEKKLPGTVGSLGCQQSVVNYPTRW